VGKQKGDIVILSIGDKKEVVIRLTNELLTQDFKEGLNTGFYKIKGASLLEKQYWFEGYELGYFGLSLDGIKPWQECIQNGKK
tara:strand:+ start:613 stop:861 length:249 start_codon:yes stop_codon:yes gene_type:complete